MLNKFFTGFVVVFWLVMMTMLIRVEYFPRETRLLTVPTSRVLDKIFHANSLTTLDVIYRGQSMGSFVLDVSPVISALPESPDKPAQPVEAYTVKGTLLGRLNFLGTPSRITLHLESLFDRQYDMKKFFVDSKIGDTHAEIRGDNASRILDVTYGFADERQSRRLTYDELSSQNLISALGLPGMQGISALGAVGMPAPSRTHEAGKKTAPLLDVRTYVDTLQLARGPQRAYLMEITMENSLNFWAKIWIDEQGNIQLVDTSTGLMLRSSDLAQESQQAIDRTFESAPRKE